MAPAHCAWGVLFIPELYTYADSIVGLCAHISRPTTPTDMLRFSAMAISVFLSPSLSLGYTCGKNSFSLLFAPLPLENHCVDVREVLQRTSSY